jgi:hypothetical protein
MTTGETTRETEVRPATWRLVLARILVVLGALFAAVTIVAGYVHWQAFDNDTFRNTAGDLIANEAIRDEVATELVEQLYANVDVEAELEDRLPEDQKRLAGPISAAIRQLAERAALEALERPRAQALFRDAAATSHATLVAALRDELGPLETEEGDVYLDLRQVVIDIGERIAIVGNLGERLPEDAGRIRIVEAERLERAQDVTALFEGIATWIWVVPFLLWGAAIWLAPGRRRVELRAIAIGIVIAGVLVLVIRAVAGDYVVGELTTTTSAEEAASEAWAVLTELLVDGAWAAIALGLVALLGVWLAGPTTSGRAVRAWLAPVLARPDLAYGIVAILFLVVIWWAPFAQARRPLYLLAAAVLLAIGIEALRRLTAHEYPDARATEPHELLRPVLRLWPSRARAAPRAAAGYEATRIDQLERLARLHEQGLLTDEELAIEKARLLAE